MQGLADDLPRLQLIDNYWMGRHPNPYQPKLATDEYKLLARRAVTNLMPSVVMIPTQVLYVDGIRSGVKDGNPVAAAHWEHWQRSHLDAGQIPIISAAIAYGLSFTVTEHNRRGLSVTRGLSPLKTFALFEYPQSDMDPLGAFTILREARTEPGRGYFWDEKHRWDVTFDGLRDEKPKLSNKVEHGLTVCPVTRFAPLVDLSGRCIGVIEPMMRLQDRVNQTVFDLLLAQSEGSWRTRTVTGMAPPLEMERIEVEDPVTGETSFEERPRIDDAGNYIQRPIKLNLSDILYAENPDTKFGILDGTPIEGYIQSLDQVLRHFTTISQTPPHYMLGQIANLSADAMQAAETTLMRRCEQFRTALGESWERDFRLLAELSGDQAGAEDYEAEVLWRDMDAQSLSRVADALGKLREMLEIPAEELWSRVPGATPQEIDRWREAKANSPEAALAGGLSTASRFLGAATEADGGEQASTGLPRRDWSA